MNMWVIAAFLAIVLLILLVVQVLHIVAAYRAATGTPWQKFLAAFSHSVTILFARIVSFGAAAFAFGIDMLPTLDPSTQLGQALSTVLTPQYVPIYVLAFGLIVETLRRRRSSVDPITAPKLTQ